MRVYTPSDIYNELEMAKTDYLHASICISQHGRRSGSSSSSKLFIPKLLDWYMLDFAEDMESLVEWVSLQLSNSARLEELTKCVKKEMDVIQIVPYDFSFRYIFL